MNDNIKPSASSSAAGLDVPDFPHFFPATVNPDEKEAQLERLRAIKRGCEAKGDNKNDCVITLILCCLDDGINTVGGLVNVLRQVGCNGKHVAKVVGIHRGVNPRRYLWSSDAEGRLAPHSDAI